MKDGDPFRDPEHHTHVVFGKEDGNAARPRQPGGEIFERPELQIPNSNLFLSPWEMESPNR